MERNSKHAKTTIEDFEILSRIGEGSFAQVFKGRRKIDKQIYALKKIKMISLSEKDQVYALNEVRILASYNGQNIIGFKEAFYDEMCGSLWIVLEFAEKGDLLERIVEAKKTKTTIEESEIWKACLHITKGLKSLHDKKILHRDIKSANVFIMEDGTYKLGDLNVCKVLKNRMAKTHTGTPYYTSP